MVLKEEILEICKKKEILLDKSLIDSLSLLEEDLAKKIILSFFNLNLKVKFITKNLFLSYYKEISDQFNDNEKTLLKNFFVSLGFNEKDLIIKNEEKEEKREIKENNNIKIVFSPQFLPKKISVDDFVNYFRARYEQIKNILLEKNLDKILSIRRISNERSNFWIICLVYDKRITKNNNIILEVEDLTGKTTILVNSNKKEVFEKAKNLLLDEVIAIKVSGDKKFLFADEIIFPDSSLPNRKKLEEEEVMVVISDLHVGSSLFFEKNFLKFVDWINGKLEAHKDLAKKAKYLFVVGDSVDGVGIFPGQEKLLAINDIKKQYEKLAELLSLIRDDIKIIICPGQHDAVWVGEPQPIIGEEWASELYKMKNVFLVSNPAVIQIRDKINVLMYHGAGMHEIIESIEEIRIKYGHRCPTIVTKEMLKRRHLSPSHGSNDYIPTEKKDYLVIENVPDIVLTGDQHRSEVLYYNNILLIASSCWQAKTPFEEKIGHEPDPCKVPILNLKTREVKILDFSEDERLD